MAAEWRQLTNPMARIMRLSMPHLDNGRSVAVRSRWSRLWRPRGDSASLMPNDEQGGRRKRSASLSLRQCRLFDPNRLDICELADAKLGQLPSVAAALYAPKRKARIRHDHPIDEDAPRLNISRQCFPAINIPGP